jgi:hypothetical protein
MDGQPSDVYSSPTAERDDADIGARRRGPRPVAPDAPPDSALWSRAKRQSFSAMKTNPNAYFYRHVAPGQIQRTGPWSAAEKRLFLEAAKAYPPSGGKWRLFAARIPGRVGYQCRNFYHRLLQAGEMGALPGEPAAAKRAQGAQAAAGRGRARRRGGARRRARQPGAVGRGGAARRGGFD